MIKTWQQRCEEHLDHEGIVTHQMIMERMQEEIDELRQALAQPEQEPVAFYVYKPTLPHGNLGNVADGNLSWVYDQDPSSGYSARMLVYTAPPKKEWVGLTEAEIIELAGGGITRDERMIAHAIEAWLKEKNT
jgi:hypothetical protein